MHLFLTGSVQIGKTTALNKTLELLKVTPAPTLGKIANLPAGTCI